ncbi:hypothetical protein BJV74DRAFT_846662 [Russula compacta]|nr:hypothetical protein BJV74DRAFT_846662 [Russula compacta]
MSCYHGPSAGSGATPYENPHCPETPPLQESNRQRLQSFPWAPHHLMIKVFL